jgi:hypothetical protein
MTRFLTLFLALVAMLIAVAPAPAAQSGQDTGSISWSADVGCSMRALTSDGQQVYAFGAAGSDGGVQLRFLGGGTFLD